VGTTTKKKRREEFPWYQYLVKVAAKEIDDPRVHGSSSAEHRGLNLLRSARRVQLKRLMRARDDSALIDFQLAMRQTQIVHPISDLFLDQLHVVTVDDLRDDAAWCFAPVGVLSHVERDFINLK
jgi:hypothetical protein